MTTETTLRESYFDAVQKLIPFTAKVRRGSQLKVDEIQHVFSNAVWEDQNKKSGHVKLQNKVTGIVVEYQGHTSGSDNVVKQHIKDQLLTQVQTHLNILCNYVFQYVTHNWQTEPDYTQSLANYRVWVQTKPLPPI